MAKNISNGQYYIFWKIFYEISYNHSNISIHDNVYLNINKKTHKPGPNLVILKLMLFIVIKSMTHSNFISIHNTIKLYYYFQYKYRSVSYICIFADSIYST